MALTYKNARQAVGTSYTTVYTCPAATQAVVVAVQVANLTALSANVSLQWLDSSASNAATRLINALPIPGSTAVSLLAGPLVLEPGDVLQALASATSSFELSVSITEIT